MLGRIYEDLILYNYRIRSILLIFLSELKKLKNKYLFLISILDNFLFLSRDYNFFSLYSELLLRL